MVITALTRNFLKSWLFSPLKKPINTGFSPVRKLNILLFFPSVLSKSFRKKCGITYTESCPSGRRCSTRNAVYRNVPRVRIPNSPPKKPEKSRFFGLFFLPFCSKSAQNYGKNSLFFGKNKAISGILAYSNRKNQFFPPSFEISVHLLLKFTDSGSAIPLTIAFAEDSFEV